jgi:hypothetical protein
VLKTLNQKNYTNKKKRKKKYRTIHCSPAIYPFVHFGKGDWGAMGLQVKKKKKKLKIPKIFIGDWLQYGTTLYQQYRYSAVPLQFHSRFLRKQSHCQIACFVFYLNKQTTSSFQMKWKYFLLHGNNHSPYTYMLPIQV